MNKVVVITGASSGIGRQCALRLAGPNVDLVLIARREKELELVAMEVRKMGATTHCLAVDLHDTTKLKIDIDDIIRKLVKIDVLINNAGISIEKTFAEGDLEEWDYALDINLKSVIHLTRYCLKAMGEGGAMIFIGSTASRRAYARGTNYCAAKFGLLGFTGALFEDIRERGIKVCTILPGLVNTDMHKDDVKLDPAKMIQPEDVALTVQFILSTPANLCPTEITLLPQKNPKTR